MANSSIELVNLDFAYLKEDFKNYMRSQDLFKDYDFEGSNISVLLDTLAYNTFKNVFYLNMVASESFLDSAQLRSSVLSHSKLLNYTPRSRKSAKANITVNFQATGESQPYIIEKGSTFTGISGNDNLILSVPETISVSSSNNSFTFTTDLYQGVYLKENYIVPYQNIPDTLIYKLTNTDVDIDSLNVNVYENSSSLPRTYSRSTSLLDLTGSSEVYFLQCSGSGSYEILFGDNLIGKKPKAGSIIELDYRLSSAEEGNGIKSIDINFDPSGGELAEDADEPEVIVNAISSGGSERESLESIKYYAPRHFQVQERAVTTDDYEIILKTQFPEISAITVYGGEEEDPPQFGRVFVSIDVAEATGIPYIKKQSYSKFLKTRSPLSIEPIIIEPKYLYIDLDINARYNLNITKNTAERIKALIRNNILEYNTNNLNDFNSILRYSKLLNIIDNSDTSIVSNITDLEIHKEIIEYNVGNLQNISFSFNCKLIDDIPKMEDNHPVEDRHCISSNTFRYGSIICSIEDNGDSELFIVQKIGSIHKKIKKIGSVNYNTGMVNLNGFISDYIEDGVLKIYARPHDNDVSVSKNTILTIKPNDIKINVQAVRV